MSLTIMMLYVYVYMFPLLINLHFFTSQIWLFYHFVLFVFRSKNKQTNKKRIVVVVLLKFLLFFKIVIWLFDIRCARWFPMHPTQSLILQQSFFCFFEQKSTFQFRIQIFCWLIFRSVMTWSSHNSDSLFFRINFYSFTESLATHWLTVDAF